MTGMDFIYESSTFLTVAMFIISAATALAINREADEDSADILWALPIDNASMIFGKFLGLMPMVLFAAAAYWLPHAVMITAKWTGSGLSIWYLAGELGFAALMQGAGMISAALIASIAVWSVQLAAGQRLKAFYLIASPGDSYWAASRWVGLVLAAALTAWACFMLRRANKEDTPSCE
jgi:ABC-type transport system involved in multi-copper enzyme maturation permease subunit